jgi:hypothetical protein
MPGPKSVGAGVCCGFHSHHWGLARAGVSKWPPPTVPTTEKSTGEGGRGFCGRRGPPKIEATPRGEGTLEPLFAPTARKHHKPRWGPSHGPSQTALRPILRKSRESTLRPHSVRLGSQPVGTKGRTGSHKPRYFAHLAINLCGSLASSGLTLRDSALSANQGGRIATWPQICSSGLRFELACSVLFPRAWAHKTIQLTVTFVAVPLRSAQTLVVRPAGGSLFCGVTSGLAGRTSGPMKIARAE